MLFAELIHRSASCKRVFCYNPRFRDAIIMLGSKGRNVACRLRKGVIKYEIVPLGFVDLGGCSDGWMLEHGLEHQSQERCAKQWNRPFRG